LKGKIIDQLFVVLHHVSGVFQIIDRENI
jgi:hypothetical protein